MKKQITLLFVLIISTIAFGQNMKVKKDQILLEKIPVANLAKEKGLFTLSKLDNTDAVTIKIEHCILSDKFYLQITNVATQATNQKTLTTYSAMAPTKFVLSILEESGFVTESGVQTDKINAFIEGEKFDFAKEYGCALINEGKEKIKEMNLQVFDDGLITKGNNAAVGKIYRSVTLDVIKYEDYTYKLYDKERKLVATVQGKMVG